MNKTIIFASNLNSSETLKSLAMNGVNTIGMRIMNAPELARLSLMKSGVAITEKILKQEDEMILIAESVSNEKYFGKASYADIRNIRSAITTLRNLSVVENESKYISEVLSNGIFKEKNHAIVNVYTRYMSALKGMNCIDGVLLVRRAIELSKQMDSDFICLKEYHLSPLEKQLIEKLSGGSYRVLGLSELYNAEKKNPQAAIIKNCYGSTNEVESIIDNIYRGKAADKCVVAVTDSSSYSQLFFDYAVEQNIPVTFGCGIPISNSNPAALLKLYINWITGGFFGTEALVKMISDNSFDFSQIKESLYAKEDFPWNDFINILGNLRLTNDKQVNENRIEKYKNAVVEEEKLLSKRYGKSVKYKNELIPALEKAAGELALPPEEFISKYSLIRKENKTFADGLVSSLDMAALSSLCDEIRTVRKAGQDISDVIDDLLKLNVCRQGSSEGKIHITDISGAFSVQRPYLYIAGMSSSKYPGLPSENYLLLDADYELFGPDAIYLTSKEKIKRRIDQFSSVIDLAASLKSEINISYPGMNVSDLKKDNASSVIFDLLRKIHGENISWREMNSKIESVKYFDPAMSLSGKIGIAYNEEKIIKIDKYTERRNVVPVNTEQLIEKQYSPSALEMFFNCQRKFMFMYVLGIEEPGEYDNFEIISPVDKGNLAHQLMEKLADNPEMSLDEFKALSDKCFCIFLDQHPSVITEDSENIKAEFTEMMEKAYNSSPHNKVVLKEEDIVGEHESGIKIHGYPDCVEETEDGSCIVVDYKTGNKIKHEANDIDTCLQIVIYSYILEQKGFHIKEGQYRYINADETVTCVYNDEMKSLLAKKLSYFKSHLSEAKFECCDSEDVCQYCGYKVICGRSAEENE